jgi:hypothetical protein
MVGTCKDFLKMSSIPLASIQMLQTMRDDKDLRQTAHPMDRLSVLLEMATRDEDVKQKHLINTLLIIIGGLHTRICDLEEAAAEAAAEARPPTHRQINNPEDEDSE